MKCTESEIQNAERFLTKFAKEYTSGDERLALESLQFNQDCLTKIEKRHLQVLRRDKFEIY